MTEPVVPRAYIAKQALTAARRFALSRRQPLNPYPAGSAAAEAWRADLERWKPLVSVPNTTKAAATAAA